MRDRFAEFHDMASRLFVPGALEIGQVKTFDVRVESIILEPASALRLQSTPIASVRTGAHVEKSANGFFCASLAIAGQFLVHQADRTIVANPGDLAIFDCDLPCSVMCGLNHGQDNLTLVLPKNRLPPLPSTEKALQNTLISHSTLLAPLAESYKFIGTKLLIASNSELTDLINACVSLLPFAVGCFDTGDQARTTALGHKAFAKIIEFVDDNLASTELSAMVTASALGMTDRYVHRLFAARGTTFSAYVTQTRLERIRRELLSKTHAFVPISALAYRWGFNDISTFNKAFKRRFGLPPRCYRNKLA